MSAAEYNALILFFASRSAKSDFISSASPNPLIMILHPAFAKAPAMPLPMPLVLPVMRTDLPFNIMPLLDYS